MYSAPMKILVFGTFDHLHPGHLSLLGQGAARGELHVVIARDAHVEEIKGRRPDESEQQRLENVQKAVPDAFVILGDADDYLVPVREIQPDLILLGYDQKLPPEVQMDDLPCPVERADAFEPEIYKSSLMKPNSRVESA